MHWLILFKNASLQTKWFVINSILWAILIIGTTLYCYARLDFVRSYETHPNTQTHKERQKL